MKGEYSSNGMKSMSKSGEAGAPKAGRSLHFPTASEPQQGSSEEQQLDQTLIKELSMY